MNFLDFVNRQKYKIDEIIEYVEQTAQGRCRCMKWENIRSLLRLAVVNNRLTEKQAQYLEEKYCRENKHSN